MFSLIVRNHQHEMDLRMIKKNFFAYTLVLMMALMLQHPAMAMEDPHGSQPADDMTYLPHLTGLRNKVFKNQYGRKKSLSEAVVLRGSEIKEGKATVPAGGLFYITEVDGDAEPFMRDPFMLLGEHCYLVDIKTGSRTIKNFKVKKGEKPLVADTGYRVWFDYATDHYEIPYGEMALISPSGGWPLEFPIASDFPSREEARKMEIGEGYQPQVEPFYLDKEYFFGASYFKAKHFGFDEMEFEEFRFPTISEATFSMTRPWAMDVHQDTYRIYKNKRIYAFREFDGFRVRVTDLFGGTVIAEKKIKPATTQGYKSIMDEQDNYHLTIPEEDMRIEIMVHPDMLKHSDFVPWSTGKGHGYRNGTLSFVIYSDLFTVKAGEAWPLDNRYKVGLEPHGKTGMLQRVTLENAEPLTFDNANDSYDGPIKWSHFWNRNAFKVVANDFREDKVFNVYLRDYYAMRTENMVFHKEEGRKNMDFFVGTSPVLEPILEDTFLTRLADTTFGGVVEGSHFSSFPKVMPNSAFHEPDHTAPFVPRLKGLKRKISRNRKKERLLSSESVFIRGSYVDYKNGKIIIPPAGLCYSSRNARNMRTLAAENFFVLGRKAWLTTFTSSTFVRKDFDLDFWKNQPMGDGNLMYWQDQLLGVRNKTLRFTGFSYLDDRPVAQLSLMKYSGNRWGAHFYMAQGFDREKDNRYHMAEVFGEGATWIKPEYIGSNYVKIKEFATPSIEGMSFSYNKPKSVKLGAGDTAKLGKYTLACTAVDQEAGTVSLELRDKSGNVLAEKVIGPLNEETNKLLPQMESTAKSMQLPYEDLLAELDVKNPWKGDKAQLWTYTDVRYLKRDTPFEFDNRFMVRPDVCGHCYQFNELLLDNPEPIVLDKDNPVYEGPKGEDGTPLFKIVIDDFDGEMIHAWHVETQVTKKGKTEIYKTENLAFRPRDNVDVLIGVTGSTEGFLRLSMLPRLGFMEAWRTGHKASRDRMSGSVNTGGSAHIQR